MEKQIENPSITYIISIHVYTCFMTSVHRIHTIFLPYKHFTILTLYI